MDAAVSVKDKMIKYEDLHCFLYYKHMYFSNMIDGSIILCGFFFFLKRGEFHKNIHIFTKCIVSHRFRARDCFRKLVKFFYVKKEVGRLSFPAN